MTDNPTLVEFFESRYRPDRLRDHSRAILSHHRAIRVLAAIVRHPPRLSDLCRDNLLRVERPLCLRALWRHASRVGVMDRSPVIECREEFGGDTLRGYFEDVFFADRFDGLSLSTLKQYRVAVRKYEKFRDAAVTPRDVTPERLSAFRAWAVLSGVNTLRARYQSDLVRVVARHAAS